MSVQPEPVTITPYPDGPLIVRGPVRILDSTGSEIDPGRSTVALCRCGRSALKPFCERSHNAVRFRASGGDDRMWACLLPAPDPAGAVGGDPQARIGVAHSAAQDESA